MCDLPSQHLFNLLLYSCFYLRYPIDFSIIKLCILYASNNIKYKLTITQLAMLGYTKPLYQAQKQLQYEKHLKRLEKINNKRVRSVQSRNTLDEMHKIRDVSFQFKNQKTIDTLNHQNEKILDKILSFTKKKSTPNVFTPKNKMIFNNPTRKKREQQISHENMLLAQKLLSKQNQCQKQKIFHAIQQYQKVKRTLQHNKRLQVLPLIKTGHSIQSRIKTPSLINRTQTSQAK